MGVRATERARRGGADVDESPHHAWGGRRPAGAPRGARARVFACVSHIILALDLGHFSQRGARPANASTPLRPIALPLQGARTHSFSTLAIFRSAARGRHHVSARRTQGGCSREKVVRRPLASVPPSREAGGGEDGCHMV